MREGPLSQLFKRTDVDTPPGEAAPQESEPRREERPRAEPPREEPAADERGLDYAQPRIPSPKERLSAAFSHDIPHDVLERPRESRENQRPWLDAGICIPEMNPTPRSVPWDLGLISTKRLRCCE